MNNVIENIQYDAVNTTLTCRGEWDLTHLATLQQQLDKLPLPTTNKLAIKGDGIVKMDSAGAWILDKWQEKLRQNKIEVNFIDFAKSHLTLLNMVRKEFEVKPYIPPIEKINSVAYLGKKSIEYLYYFLNYVSFIGSLAIEMLALLRQPKRMRWSSLAGVIYRTGYQALPILALLSFLIGVVLTYQMGLQLKTYGANIFIVNLLGLAILREFAPLLTAIIVAGRTGSAFTAQLGMMKLNQEIDALNTMGVTPGELLLLPRIIGLVIALPLVTIWSDIFGVIGGMVMSNNMLNISWYDFLHRFPHVITLSTLLIGLGKTPVFALIIASVGCYQGMNVKLNADSIGKNTTRSVVQSIFFIIVADALFSIIFSYLKL